MLLSAQPQKCTFLQVRKGASEAEKGLKGFSLRIGISPPLNLAVP